MARPKTIKPTPSENPNKYTRIYEDEESIVTWTYNLNIFSNGPISVEIKYKNEQTTENRNKLVIISILLIITTLLVILQRVHSKCHSILQVVTGSILGSILAVISYILSNRMNDQDFPILHGSILGTVGTILGAVLGIVIYILSSRMNNQYLLIY